jgi:CheY-like chemotaxis protein
MNMRREDRVPARIGTTVTCLTSDGQVLVQRATTIDVSDQGGCLEGLRFLPPTGSIVGVQNGQKRARFRVIWNGEPGSSREGHVGVERLEGATESTPVLYIDDDVLSATERAARLSALGYHVTHARSPIEGFEKLIETQFSLVIAAYPLRDIDTTELLIAIRRSGSKAKIMLLSGYGKLPDALLEIVDAPAMKTDPMQLFVNTIERVLEDQKHIKFPTRSYRRYAVKVPVAVEVLRAGEKMMFYGTSSDLSERGIGALIRAALVPGEMVKVFFSLPNSPAEIDAHALVRHRTTSGEYGFEFISVPSGAVQTIKTLCAVLPSIGAAKAATS